MFEIGLLATVNPDIDFMGLSVRAPECGYKATVRGLERSERRTQNTKHKQRTRVFNNIESRQQRKTSCVIETAFNFSFVVCSSRLHILSFRLRLWDAGCLVICLR